MTDYSAYIESNRKRLCADSDVPDRSGAALATARALARRLQEDLGIRRVVLFGSLAHGTFGPHSDVDLAIEGVADSRVWYRALRLADAVHDFDISLFPLEDAPEHLRRIIDADGIVLWPG